MQINVLLNTNDVFFKMRYIFSHKMITATRERAREWGFEAKKLRSQDENTQRLLENVLR